MGKAVLISIKPKWCELIADGKKTVEVRKTRPKLDTPFKCYIYCTKAKEHFTHGGVVDSLDDLFRLPSGEIKHGYSGELMCFPAEEWGENNFLNGKVIGEFVCRDILTVYQDDFYLMRYLSELAGIGLSDLRHYAGYSDFLYGFHISDLKIYDEPKELGEFMTKPCDFAASCGACVHSRWSEIDYSKFVGCSFGVKRPPQSWCYVEELT